MSSGFSWGRTWPSRSRAGASRSACSSSPASAWPARAGTVLDEVEAALGAARNGAPRGDPHARDRSLLDSGAAAGRAGAADSLSRAGRRGGVHRRAGAVSRMSGEAPESRADEAAAGPDREASVALAREIARLAESKLGTDVVVLDVGDLVGYTDFLVVCTAPERAAGEGDPRRGLPTAEARSRAAASERRGRARVAMGADGLPRLRAPRLRPGAARALPARTAMGRGRAARAGLDGKSVRVRPSRPLASSFIATEHFKRSLFGYRRADVDEAIAGVTRRSNR